ncbi:chloride channel protein [Glacieibacterium sp.]|uniref:chloride channel protein n=1 Tax=Glacieibacterium sp. TaxID=2860237 RepID=UPI003B00ACFD
MDRTTKSEIHAVWIAALGPVWRSRAAAGAGALLIGLVAVGFAAAADLIQQRLGGFMRREILTSLLVTPLLFAALVYLTRRFAPAAAGSGIPQVIAVARNVENLSGRGLVSMRTAAAKLLLTLGGLIAGASVGREGPTVQIGAALMVMTHRIFRVPLTSGVLIAGGAAGVAGAFNAPLAGVAFAIEELAAAYEQRLAVLVMGAVVAAGLISRSVTGDYVYFGVVHAALATGPALLIAPVAGVIGGVSGGLFSRAFLGLSRWLREHPRIGSRPVLVALVCGIGVSLIAVASGGLTWGTGYEPARSLLEGGAQPIWFAPAKLISTLLTGLSGLPGGIFAPSLATGAGLGGLLAMPFPTDEAPAIVVIGMVAYFVGVVRAPLTGVIIVSEMTANRGLLLPLFLAAIIADFAANWVCPERLYHGLAKRFLTVPAASDQASPERA